MLRPRVARGALIGVLASVHVALVAWMALPVVTRTTLDPAPVSTGLQWVALPASPDPAPAPRPPARPGQGGDVSGPGPVSIGAVDRRAALEEGLQSLRGDHGVDEWARSRTPAGETDAGFRARGRESPTRPFATPVVRLPGREEAFVDGIHVRSERSPEAIVTGLAQSVFGRPRPETCADIRQRLSVPETGVARDIDLDKLRRFCSTASP